MSYSTNTVINNCASSPWLHNAIVRILLLLTLSVACVFTTHAQSEKPRVIVLTDIGGDPDDKQSLVRFLLYSNQFDVEALIASTSKHKDKAEPKYIREIVNTYGKVRDNLTKHATGYPTAGELLSVVSKGRSDYGLNGVGKGKDSPGSDKIIDVVDKEDSRPVWVLVWGGPNVLAQSLWKVRNERSSKALHDFVSKLRVYTISDQDDSGPWLRETFPNLFYIASPGFHYGGAYHYCTWSGISGDKFWGRFDGADFSIVDNPWLDKHIRSKGPLGKQYPHTEFLMEGDSPSFMYLINNGLGNPERPDWGSWGGRYEHYRPRTKKYFLQPETRAFWTDAEDEVLGVDSNWHTSNKATIWRWRSAYQNDFSARMDWTIKSYEESNHPPEVKLDHPDRITARPGEKVNLSAKSTSDPDGDDLNYHWFYYDEAGTFTMAKPTTGYPLEIENADRPKASFTVPTERVFRNGTMHIILKVTDEGSPALTRYERVIVTVRP